MRSALRARAGFTLLELTVAITILAFVAMSVYQITQHMVGGREIVRRGLESPKVQNAILGQVFRDFRYLYWVDFVGNAGFVGSSRTEAGQHADRVDFVTARRSRVARPEDAGSGQRVPESPLTEVGYALRPSDRHPGLLELWRREDWFVDDDPTSGGEYSLIYDRIKSFNVTYFEIPEDRTSDEHGLEEWDSRLRGQLPYALILQIEFFTGDPPGPGEDREPHRITRIVLVRAGAQDAAGWKTAETPAQNPPGGQPPRRP